MTLHERIEKIKPCFKGFNVDAKEGVSVLLAKFPVGWTVPDAVSKSFNLQTETHPEGVYFVTEIENGIDELFDAVEYIIEYNQSIIEKSEILKEKINELKDLFVRESVERLKTLQFTFGSEAVVSKESATTKKNTRTGKKTAEKKEKPEAAPVNEIPEAPITEEPENNDDNDLMSLAKGLTN
jgi:hypothetical protein